MFHIGVVGLLAARAGAPHLCVPAQVAEHVCLSHPPARFGGAIWELLLGASWAVVAMLLCSGFTCLIGRRDNPVTCYSVQLKDVVLWYAVLRRSSAIRSAVLRYDVTHPVVNDQAMAMWRDLGVNSWPTLAVVSPRWDLGTGRRPGRAKLPEPAKRQMFWLGCISSHLHTYSP